MALLAEDLFLLLLDRGTGALAGRSHHRMVLGGALLSELALDGHAVLEPKAGLLHRPRVRVTGAPPAAPLLASAYAAVGASPRTPQDLVNRLGTGVRERLVADLVRRGVLREERVRAYGVLPQTRWPAASAYLDDAVRQRVAAVLVLGQPPDPRTRALVALLSAAGLAHKVIDTQRVPARDVRRRAKELAEGDWAARGVRDAISAASSSSGG